MKTKSVGRWFVALSVVALVAIGFASVEAWFAAEGTTISACMKITNGQLRVVADGEPCLDSETPIQWNVEGPQGIQGPQGDPGLPGAPGPAGVSGYEIVVDETPVDPIPSKQLIVDCPAGKRALGAGWSVLDPTSAILEGRATYFEPSFDGSSWVANASNDSVFAPIWKLRLRVICADVD